MAVGTTKTSEEFTAISAGSACNVTGMKVYDAEQIVVYLTSDGTKAVLGVDYALSIAGDNSGCTVTPTAALVLRTTGILVARETALTSDFDIAPNGKISEPRLVEQLDRDLMRDQERGASLARALKVPPGETLPAIPGGPTERAGKWLFFDASGNPTVGDGPVVETNTTPRTTTQQLAATSIPASVSLIETTGFAASGDRGGAHFADTGLAAPPVGGKGYVVSGSRVWGIYEEVLMPQQFGAKGDGVTDDTAAFADMLKAAADRKLPVYIPSPPVAWKVGPVDVPAVEGQVIRGQNMRTTIFRPLANAQPYMLAIPYAAANLDISDLYFDQYGKADADRAAWAVLSDAGQQLRMHRIRVETAKGGIWWRKGGYNVVKDLVVSRHTQDAYRFAGEYTGGGGTLQLAQSEFANLLAETGIYDSVSGTGATGTAFSFLSGAAFLNCKDFVAAGQINGAYVADSNGGGVTTRPDGITFTNPNIDWTQLRAFQVAGAGLVRVFKGSFRSLTDFAMTFQNCRTAEISGTRAYNSHLGGLAILGGVEDLHAEDLRLLGNGWPTNTGGVGVYVVGANGVLKFVGGENGNGFSGTPNYYPWSVSALQDYGFYVDASATGQLEIDGMRVRANRLASHNGLLDASGDLRSGFRVVNSRDDGFRTESQGRATLTADGAGVIDITHGLLGRPAYANVQRLGAAQYPRPAVTAIDATKVRVTMVDNANNAVAGASADLMWEARMRV